MKPDHLQTIKDRNIQVTPLISNGVTIGWGVGIRMTIENRGYVPNHLYANGYTLEEAIDKLLDGRTLFKLDKDGYLVENEPSICD